MDPETGIYEMIKNDAAIMAIVGDRIFPSTVPQGHPVPLILVTQVEEDEQGTKDGPVPSGWTFEVAAIAEDNPTARQLSRLVKKALNWKTTTLATGETIRSRFVNESDASYDQEQQYFQIVQPYRCRKIR
jgi:hypothetical protein